jgi:DNA-binding NarL/FixJ family response regulator
MVRTIPFRVSLVDPHPITLDGLTDAFTRSRRFEVVSRSTSAAEARLHLRTANPELLIVDLGLPAGEGEALLTEIRRGASRPRVLVFSESIPTAAIETALDLGIDGFISKRLGSADIVEEASRLVAFRSAPAPAVIGFDDPRQGEALRMLSAREQSILAFAARGLSNKEIAAEVGITHGTVKVHLHAIYRKLGVNRRTELTRFAESERAARRFAAIA